jgi:putative pyoverdin transport system ATP-binding/permease protein
MYRNISA